MMRDALAAEFGVSREVLWNAFEGKGGPPRFLEALVRSGFPLLTPENFHEPYDDGLLSVSKDATTDTVTQAQIDTDVKIRGPLPDDHPFANALRAKRLSVAEWARKHKKQGLTVAKVKSWIRTVDARQIPRKWADTIERELEVPATARTWKQGIRDEK